MSKNQKRTSKYALKKFHFLSVMSWNKLCAHLAYHTNNQNKYANA